MIETTPEGMTKELWINRCAARIRQRVIGISDDQCVGIAEACFENLDNDLMEHPEDAADEELSCWTDDGE